MNEPTKKQEEALREFLHSAVVPLIEDVLVKKLGQAMSYAKEQFAIHKREWIGLTDEELNNIPENGNTDWMKRKSFVRAVEAKLREKNDTR